MLPLTSTDGSSKQLPITIYLKSDFSKRYRCGGFRRSARTGYELGPLKPEIFVSDFVVYWAPASYEHIDKISQRRAHYI